MGFIQPFDFETLFVNTLAGSLLIFTMLAFVVILIIAAKYKMRNLILLTCLALFSVLMADYIGGLYLIAIILVGYLIYQGIAEFMK